MPRSAKEPATRIQHNQNFFHLFCIQAVAIGTPPIVVGKQLAEQYGASTAICSIIIGNLILWMIGLAIISMVYQRHINAIENIETYIGKWGGFVFAFILVVAFLDWYAIEIDVSLKGLSTLTKINDLPSRGLVVRMGAVLGILGALLAIGGIRLLKWLTVIGFPFLTGYCLFVVLFSDYSLLSNWEWGVSFAGILMTILALLPGVINLPTFFRHSRSKPDSFLALTIMVILYAFYESSAIWMNFSDNLDFISLHPSSLMLITTSVFLVLTCMASNLLNIYLASACYETFIPHFQGTKGHAIMGLLGTAVYTFVQISSPIVLVENLLNSYIAILGIVLVIGVLARIIIRHRPRKFEKSINVLAWVIGCAVSTTIIFMHPEEWESPILVGMEASALFFLFVFFVEETWWSISKLRSSQGRGENIE
jgi:purine-cytosine permease-like protein